MTISFTRTREQLCRMVLRKLGVLASGGADVSADMDVVYEAIDVRVKEMHRQGIFWRKVDETALSFSLTASTSSASSTVDILFPIKMTVVDTSVDFPVDIISPVQYAAIVDKASTGIPSKALWKGSAEFLFWPVPYAATTAKLIYEKFADDTAASTAPDVEVSMLRWLQDIIAYDLGDAFAQSEPKMVRLRGEAQTAEKNIRKLNALRVNISTVSVNEWPSLGDESPGAGYDYQDR